MRRTSPLRCLAYLLPMVPISLACADGPALVRDTSTSSPPPPPVRTPPAAASPADASRAELPPMTPARPPDDVESSRGTDAGLELDAGPSMQCLQGGSFAPRTPTVYVLVDRSGTMFDA